MVLLKCKCIVDKFVLSTSKLINCPTAIQKGIKLLTVFR